MGGYDKIIAGLGLGSTAAIAAAAFAPGIGAGMPISSTFAWHTVMMTLGFAVFMSLGRRAYKMELPDNMDTSKQSRRMLHVCLMITATLCVALGYSGIFIAHYPGKQFFGYDFTKAEWKPIFRILHVYLGYAAVTLVVFQVLVGALKIQALQEGLAKFKFHGQVGPVAHYIGLCAICAGAYIMPWNPVLRAAVAMGVMGIAVLTNKASSEDTKAETQGLLGK
eukprot:gnl/MRDRNA2_/MRDRNA2_76291_c0_seq1.p1 gnl/MRDRNA2_/MRDRNA2_76291_c0~~gnl/MRDRNA2_/MRDRNA2_76291_c0_seq1.p1  ORF type:complete len:249 (+),score=49.07 gnl/MRDRNA2_/MRDRNA2_76291_c0_seq1:84-749(+)